MNYQEIKQQENFLANLAQGLSYTVIEGQLLICKPNKRTGEMEFGLTKPENLYARKCQGYTECVSASTLIDIFGNNFETSEDGIEEAKKVIVWMDAQK